MLIRLYTKVKRRDIPRLKKENVKLVAKLWEFILAIFKDPYDGIGKPEPLKGDLEGCWSRRLTDKHRLVYKIIEREDEEEDILEILSCYGHYGDK